MFPYLPEPIKKKSWHRGPWQGEPACSEWTDSNTGLYCAIIRQSHYGTLNGYVAIDPDHPLHGVSHNARLTLIGRCPSFWREKIGCHDIPTVARVLPAHHNLTYSDCDERGLWWFGFDCAHPGDLIPAWGRGASKGRVYCDIKFVSVRVTELAAALAEFRGFIPDIIRVESNSHTESV